MDLSIIIPPAVKIDNKQLNYYSMYSNMSQQDPGLEQYFERLNIEATEDLHNEATRMSERVVARAFAAIKGLILTDQVVFNAIETGEQPIGSTVVYFTSDELLAAPFRDEEPQRTISGLFAPRGGDPLETPKLIAHYPVPDELINLTLFDLVVEDLPVPSTMHFELIGKLGDRPERYTIDRDIGLSYYIAAVDDQVDAEKDEQPQQTTEFDAVVERNEAFRFAKKVESGLTSISKIYEDLIDMKRKPQWKFTVGSDEKPLPLLWVRYTEE